MQAASAAAAGDLQEQADDKERRLLAEVGLLLAVHACMAARLCANKPCKQKATARQARKVPCNQC